MQRGSSPLRLLLLGACCTCSVRCRRGPSEWLPVPVGGYTTHIYRNCFPGKGAAEVLDHIVHTDAGDAVGADAGAIAVGKCRDRCEARVRDGCTAFLVHPSPHGSLHCWLRKDVHLPACEQGLSAKKFHMYVRRSAEAAAAGETSI